MPALLQAMHPNNSLTLFPLKLKKIFFYFYFSLFFFRTLYCLVTSVLVEPVYYVAPTYCNYYYKNNAFMAVRFAFVSADTNAIQADTNVIQHMLGFPHQWNRWLLWLWLLLVVGFRSLCMHDHQVRVCVSWHKRDTSWHKCDTAHLGYPQQWNR